MKQQVLTVLGLLCGAAWCSATEFEPPVRLKAGGVPIRVERLYLDPWIREVERLKAGGVPIRVESIFPIQILPTLPFLKAGGVPIRVESPGFAAPCLDDKKDLYVGQFNKGKIKVYKNLGKGKFAEGVWLQAEGKDAEVPGVW